MTYLKEPQPTVDTKIVVISDTHAMDFDPMIQRGLEQTADVAIHCGDLTEESKLVEFRRAIDLLKRINAPLKLVIAGNHDFTLDLPIYRQKLAEALPPLEPSLVEREYGAEGAVQQVFDEAKPHGIVLLDEGTHEFDLDNGTKLKVYASPYTPAPVPDWGFQFDPALGHAFNIEDDTDIVITHGPPEGVLDRSGEGKRIGSRDLFEAVAHSRPRLHAFGHVHSSWGAKLVAWRPKISEKPSYLTDIDNGKSLPLEALAGLRPGKLDTEEESQAKLEKRERLMLEGTCSTLLFNEKDRRPKQGKETLFVNAAAEGGEETLTQLPWLVYLDLPRAPVVDETGSDGAPPTAKKKKRELPDASDTKDNENKRQKTG